MLVTGSNVYGSAKAKAYYLSDLSYGTTSTIVTYLINMGYEGSVTADPTKSNLKKVFNCAKADTYTNYSQYYGVDSVSVKGGTKYVG